MWKLIILLLIITLDIVAPRSEAQDASTAADAHCVVVGLRLAGSVNSPQQARGILLAWYYIGRLTGRNPKLDIEKVVIATTADMRDSDYAPEEARCEAALADEGQEVTRIGQRLMEIDATKSPKTKTE